MLNNMMVVNDELEGMVEAVISIFMVIWVQQSQRVLTFRRLMSTIVVVPHR